MVYLDDMECRNHQSRFSGKDGTEERGLYESQRLLSQKEMSIYCSDYLGLGGNIDQCEKKRGQHTSVVLKTVWLYN